jgi:hypothetical protein
VRKVITRDDRVREAIRVDVGRVGDLLDAGCDSRVDRRLVELGPLVAAAVHADQQHSSSALVRLDERLGLREIPEPDAGAALRIALQRIGRAAHEDQILRRHFSSEKLLDDETTELARGT